MLVDTKNKMNMKITIPNWERVFLTKMITADFV